MAWNLKSGPTRLYEAIETIQGSSAEYRMTLAARLARELAAKPSGELSTLSNGLHMDRQRNKAFRRIVRAIGLIEALCVRPPRLFAKIIQDCLPLTQSALEQALRRLINAQDPNNPECLLPVPWITQLPQGHEDPTGCWYASACMVGYFFEAGPRMGLPRLYSRPLSDGRLGHWATGSAGATAANASHHSDLARNENFEAVPGCRTATVFTTKKIKDQLLAHGPIFMYWFKRNGGPRLRAARTAGDGSYGHASVVIGSTYTDVIYHDPEFRQESDGANRTMSIGAFNGARQCWQWALMRRAGQNARQVAAAAEWRQGFE